MKFNEALEAMLDGKMCKNKCNDFVFKITGNREKNTCLITIYSDFPNSYYSSIAFQLEEIMTEWEIYEPPKKKLTFWQSIKNWFGKILDKEEK